MRFACALGALLVGLAGGAHAAAQRVEALDFVGPEFLPMDAPNASSSGVAGALRTRRINADGSVVLISTQATDLQSGIEDLNGESDVWLLEGDDHEPRLLSRRAGDPAVTANGSSRPVALSRDGKRALFASLATDLVAGQTDTNNAEDLFLYDLTTDSVILVSRRVPGSTATPDGASTDGMLDATGLRIVFRTTGTNLITQSPIVDTNGVDDTYLLDLSGPNPVMDLISNVHGSGVQLGNARSVPVALSLDGRYVAMISGADAMVAGQLAGSGDQAFLEDRFSGTRRMISHAASNPAQEGNGVAGPGSFSDDGRFYAFGAMASNLVAGITDSNGGCDIFLHDIAANTLALITSSAANPNATGNQGGNCGPMLNADGSRVAFASNATNLIAGLVDANGSSSDVFVQEIPSRARTLVSASTTASTSANDFSSLLDFDSAGKLVLYESEATDLVAGQQDTPDTPHVFLFSLGDGSSVPASHLEGDPAATPTTRVTGGNLSADGKTVMLQAPDGMDSLDDNDAFDVYLFRDGKAARITRGDPALDDRPTETSFASSLAQGIDASGRYVVFGSAGQRLREGLTGATTSQLWLRDRLGDSLELVTHAASGDTVRADGDHGPVALSADGEWLAYLSTSTQVVAASGGPPGAAQVYLWNRSTRATRLVSHAAGAPNVAGNAASLDLPRISADGRYVAFMSHATNLVGGQTGNPNSNGFVWDRDTGITTLVTHAAAGSTQASGGLGGLSMTPDGAFIAFASFAPDIAVGVPDTNGNPDVFLHERATGTNTPISRSRSSARMAFGGGLDPSLSADAARVVFRSASNELQSGPPTAGTSVDVYVWTRADDAVQLLSHHPSNAAQPSNGDAAAPLIDAAGRRVVFLSTATDLVPGFSTPHAGRSLFLSDLATNQVSLLSRAAGSAATASNEEPLFPVLAPDGSAVAFTSRSSNLVPLQVDAGAALDVFRIDLDTREVFLASHRLGQPAVAALPNTSAAAFAPGISGNGLLVGFTTRGDDLVRHDVGGNNAFVYVHDEPTQLLIVDVNPSEMRVGEPYVVSISLDMARGPATGRVVISEGGDSCQFDIVDDDRGGCELVSATAGPKTLQAQFTSTAGFGSSGATFAITVLPPAQADIALTMSAPASVAPGDVFDLVVETTNAGPDRSGQARVDFDGLPEVLFASGVGWTCPAVPEFHCVLDVIFVGEGNPLTLQLQAPPADAQLDIEASIDAPIADPDPGDNAAGITVQVDAAPEIAAISPVSGNTEGGYPLQVSGANFGVATGSVDLGGSDCPVTVWTPTQIVCAVPSGAGVGDVQVVQAASVLNRTTFSSFSYFEPVVTTLAPAIGSPEGNFPLTINGSNFGASGAGVAIAGTPCTNVQHDAAQPHRRVTCTVPAGSGDNLPVVVRQSGQDSDGGVRFAYAAVVSDLLIAKSSARTEVFSRNVDEWTILVSNLGPDPALGARVVDVLPAHLASVSWTCTGLAGASCGSPAGLGNIDLSVDLPVGGSALLQVTARIPRNPLLDLVNTASVEAPPGQADPAPANNSDSETDPMATVFFDDFEQQ